MDIITNGLHIYSTFFQITKSQHGSMKLRVSPIAAEIHKAALTELFEEYGEVDSIHILRSPRESIAIVDMFRVGEAEKALNGLEETDIGGLQVRVEYWHDHATRKLVAPPVTLDDDDDEEEIEPDESEDD
jgi:hypothetical protein